MQPSVLAGSLGLSDHVDRTSPRVLGEHLRQTRAQVQPEEPGTGPVLAVADATLVQDANDFPDQTLNNATPVSREQADGNLVILQLADDLYACYAHLKPGSVTVGPGDTVAKGQVMARTGNSGSSTGPHLHFQMMDRPRR